MDDNKTIEQLAKESTMYKIQSIDDCRFRDGIVEFLVKYVGIPDAEWEDEELLFCPEDIALFEDNNLEIMKQVRKQHQDYLSQESNSLQSQSEWEIRRQKRLKQFAQARIEHQALLKQQVKADQEFTNKLIESAIKDEQELQVTARKKKAQKNRYDSKLQKTLAKRKARAATRRLYAKNETSSDDSEDSDHPSSFTIKCSLYLAGSDSDSAGGPSIINTKIQVDSDTSLKKVSKQLSKKFKHHAETIVLQYKNKKGSLTELVSERKYNKLVSKHLISIDGLSQKEQRSLYLRLYACVESDSDSGDSSEDSSEEDQVLITTPKRRGKSRRRIVDSDDDNDDTGKSVNVVDQRTESSSSQIVPVETVIADQNSPVSVDSPQSSEVSPSNVENTKEPSSFPSSSNTPTSSNSINPKNSTPDNSPIQSSTPSSDVFSSEEKVQADTTKHPLYPLYQKMSNIDLDVICSPLRDSFGEFTIKKWGKKGYLPRKIFMISDFILVAKDTPKAAQPLACKGVISYAPIESVLRADEKLYGQFSLQIIRKTLLPIFLQFDSIPNCNSFLTILRKFSNGYICPAIDIDLDENPSRTSHEHITTLHRPSKTSDTGETLLTSKFVGAKAPIQDGTIASIAASSKIITGVPHTLRGTPGHNALAELDALIGGSSKPSIPFLERRFLREGVIPRIKNNKGKPRNFILFNDMLLCTMACLSPNQALAKLQADRINSLVESCGALKLDDPQDFVTGISFNNAKVRLIETDPGKVWLLSIQFTFNQGFKTITLRFHNQLYAEIWFKEVSAAIDETNARINEIKEEKALQLAKRARAESRPTPLEISTSTGSLNSLSPNTTPKKKTHALSLDESGSRTDEHSTPSKSSPGKPSGRTKNSLGSPKMNSGSHSSLTPAASDSSSIPKLANLPNRDGKAQNQRSLTSRFLTKFSTLRRSRSPGIDFNSSSGSNEPFSNSPSGATTIGRKSAQNSPYSASPNRKGRSTIRNSAQKFLGTLSRKNAKGFSLESTPQSGKLSPRGFDIEDEQCPDWEEFKDDFMDFLIETIPESGREAILKMDAPTKYKMMKMSKMSSQYYAERETGPKQWPIELKTHPITLKMLTSLSVLLRSRSSEWVSQFVASGGIEQLLNCLATVQYEMYPLVHKSVHLKSSAHSHEEHETLNTGDNSLAASFGVQVPGISSSMSSKAPVVEDSDRNYVDTTHGADETTPIGDPMPKLKLLAHHKGNKIGNALSATHLTKSKSNSELQKVDDNFSNSFDEIDSFDKLFADPVKQELFNCQVELVKSFSYLLNTRAGLRRFLAYPSSVALLCNCLQSSLNLQNLLVTLDLLTDIAKVSPDGLRLVIAGIKSSDSLFSAYNNGVCDPFSRIIQILKLDKDAIASTGTDIFVQAVEFLNGLLDLPDQIEDRVAIREALFRLQGEKHIRSLSLFEDPQLLQLIQRFEDDKENDLSLLASQGKLDIADVESKFSFPIQIPSQNVGTESVKFNTKTVEVKTKSLVSAVASNLRQTYLGNNNTNLYGLFLPNPEAKIPKNSASLGYKGHYLPSPRTKAKMGKWLRDEKRISAYENVLSRDDSKQTLSIVQLRPREIRYRVTLSTGQAQIVSFPPGTLVFDATIWFGRQFRISSSKLAEYSIYYDENATTQIVGVERPFLQPEDRLPSPPDSRIIPLAFEIRPRPIQIILDITSVETPRKGTENRNGNKSAIKSISTEPSESSESSEPSEPSEPSSSVQISTTMTRMIDFSEPLSSILFKICREHQLRPSIHSFFVQKTPEEIEAFKTNPPKLSKHHIVSVFAKFNPITTVKSARELNLPEGSTLYFKQMKKSEDMLSLYEEWASEEQTLFFRTEEDQVKTATAASAAALETKTDPASPNPSSASITPSSSSSTIQPVSLSVSNSTPSITAADLDEQNPDAFKFHESQVRGGTLSSLVVHASSDQTSHRFIEELLMTYPSFVNPSELLERFIERFNCPDNVEELCGENAYMIKIRVLNFIHTWITNYFEDFGSSSSVLQQLADFIQIHLASSEGDFIPIPKKTMARVQLADVLDVEKAELIVKGFLFVLQNEIKMKSVLFQSGKPTKVIRHSPPQPVKKPKSKIPRTTAAALHITDINTVELARQITLKQHELLRKIRSRELINVNWTRKNKSTVSPNVLIYIKHFNAISDWCAYNILSTESLRRRAKLYTKFVELAKTLVSMGNFNGAIAIVGGLESNSVHRLTHTFNYCSDRTIADLEYLNDIANPEDSFRNLRVALEAINPPIVPHLGYVQSDLLFVDEANADFLNNDHRLINFSKYAFTHKFVTQLLQYQQTGYNFDPVPSIQKYLDKLPRASPDEMWEMSLKVEPRDVSVDELVQ